MTERAGTVTAYRGRRQTATVVVDNADVHPPAVPDAASSAEAACACADLPTVNPC